MDEKETRKENGLKRNQERKENNRKRKEVDNEWQTRNERKC